MNNKRNEKKLNSYIKLNSNYSKTVLDNGLTVLTEEIPGTGSVAFGIFVNAGSRDEPHGKEGLAHFMEHAAFRSSIRRSAKQIAMGFESVGTESNAYTTQELTCFHAKSLKGHFRKSLRILCEMVFTPLLKPEEIEKERQVIIEEIKSGFDDPEEFIFDLGDEILFKGHPLGNPILGTLSSINAITTEDLRQYHMQFFNPSNLVLSFAGEFSHKRINENIEQIIKFNDLHSHAIPERKSPPLHLPGSKVMRSDLNQSHLLMGTRTPGLKSNERFSLNILNVMLGGGMSSRLYQKLRERLGIAYNVYSTLQLHEDSGAFYIYSGLNKQNASNAEKAINDELSRILSGAVSITELKRAKEQIKSSLIFEMESLANRMQASAHNEIIHGCNPGIADTLRIYDQVSKEEIVESAREYLKPELFSKISILQK